VQHLKITAEDREVSPVARLSVDPLDVKVSGYTSDPDAKLDITVDSAVNGGRLTASGQFFPASDAARFNVELSALDLTGLQPYLAAQTGMTLLSGRLGSKLALERTAAGVMNARGDMRVSELRTVDDEAKQDFIRCKDLHFSDIQYGSKPEKLSIGTVTARGAYARVIVFPDLTTNISEILTAGARVHGRARKESDADRNAQPAAATPQASAQTAPAPQGRAGDTQEDKGTAKGRKGKGRTEVAQAPTPAPLTPFPTVIKTIEVVDGSASYTDYWIQPNFAVSIQTLNGTVKGLSSDVRSRAKVRLDGKVDRYAPAQISGELNLLSATQYSDMHLSFRGVDMSTVTPYSGRFAGYKIDKGKLSVDLNYKIENRQLTAEQHFVVDQLQLGEKVESKDAVKLPVKLAVALLKDRNGVIDLDLPMTGSLDDPQFRIGPLIWKAFVNLMGKIITAPFALLGHLFGGGEHMNVIEFAPGSAELDAAATTNMQSVVKMLTERPQLKLDVPAAYATDLDRKALATARLRQQMVQGAHDRKNAKSGAPADESALADPVEHLRLAAAQYRSQMKGADMPQSAQKALQSKTQDPKELESAIHDLEAPMIERVQVPDADLEELGTKRAQAIQDALVAGGVDPTRVFVVKENRPPEGGGGKVRVEMSLK
jgi:hypothetical protein